MSRKIIQSILSSVFFMCIVTTTEAQGDPFAAYVNNVPEIIKTLSEKDTTVNGNGITVTRIVFASRDKQNSVYAIMAKPKQPGVYPAILFLHGGGSRAEDMIQHIQNYASRGYVTLSIDQPGIANPAKAIHSEGAWKTKPGGEAPRLDVKGGAQNSTLADAEIAGLEAFNLLRSQAGVDKKNIGITGFSWGGYSTTMLAGLLENKVKAAYAVFGCGFYDQGSFWKNMIEKLDANTRETWLQYLDAGRRAKIIKAAYFLDEASNDTYFWPEAASATLDAIPGNKNHVFNPNLNHKQSVYGAAMQKAFFDHHLRSIGEPFGKIEIGRIELQHDGSKKVSIKILLPANTLADSVAIYYSEKNVSWQQRAWKPVYAIKEKNNTYSATLPTDVVQKEINFYAYLLDTRGMTVSGKMY